MLSNILDRRLTLNDFHDRVCDICDEVEKYGVLKEHHTISEMLWNISLIHNTVKFLSEGYFEKQPATYNELAMDVRI